MKDKERRGEHLPGESNNKEKPKFGCGDVNIKIAPDFDEPLDDFKDYMNEMNLLLVSESSINLVGG